MAVNKQTNTETKNNILENHKRPHKDDKNLNCSLSEFEPHGSTKPKSSVGEGFVEVSYRKRSNQNANMIKRTRKNDDAISLKAAEKQAHIFITRLQKDTKTMDMLLFVRKICKEAQCEKLELLNKNRIASFRVSVPFIYKDNIIDKTSGPLVFLVVNISLLRV